MKFIQPEGWAPPRGYSNGVVATGRALCVSGQIGWTARQEFETDDFIEQFDQAVRNVVAVVGAAGGQPGDIVEMTVFVTDIDEYRARARELAPGWRRAMGRHYPAMALVAVSALVEPRAKVEIQARAVLPEEPRT